AGAMFVRYPRHSDPEASVLPSDIPITELSTNLQYNANAAYNPVIHGNQGNGRASMSYVTGSHAMKVGTSILSGQSQSSSFQLNTPPVSYSFRKATPISLPSAV